MESSKKRSIIIRSSLHSLIEKGKIVPIKIVISQGVNINSVDNLNRTALHLAALEGKLAIVKYLLKKKADVNCQDFEGYTPLHLAALHGHLGVVKDLLKTQQVNINCQSKNLYTPLHLAVIQGSLKMLDYLIEHGAIVHARNNDDDNALHLACASGHLCIVRKLIDCGVNVNESSKFLWRPIHCTILGKWYLHPKKSIDYQVPHWKLTTTERTDRLKIIDALVERGAELNYFYGFPTPLHLSVHASLCKRLIDLGADVQGYDHLGKTPLHYAAERNIPDVVDLLINNGANVDAKTHPQNATALHLAVNGNYERVASLLINAGANVNALALNEVPSILLGDKNKKIKKSLFYLLIDSGVNMNILLPTGHSALLHFFLRNYDNEVYACLFDQFLDLNTMDRHGCTPLAFITVHGNGTEKTAEFIIKLIVKMESTSNFKMNKLNSQLISSIYIILYSEYKKEIELLKKKNIWGSKYLYDFLVQPLKQLIVYSRNLEVIKIFNSGVCAEFPAYGNLIECRMRIAYARKELLERSLIKLNEIISPYKVSRYVGLNILSYLNLSNLNTLNLVVPWTTS